MNWKFQRTRLYKKVAMPKWAHVLYGCYDINTDTAYIFNTPYGHKKPHNFYSTIPVIIHETIHSILYKLEGKHTCFQFDNPKIQEECGLHICPKFFDWE